MNNENQNLPTERPVQGICQTHICRHNPQGGLVSWCFHTSTHDVQPHKEDEEEEVEAALFLLWRRGADGERDWKHRLELANSGLMASCAGSATRERGAETALLCRAGLLQCITVCVCV